MRYIVAGYGAFGRKAVEKLRESIDATNLRVVDTILIDPMFPEIVHEQMDAADYLICSPPESTDIIIPTLPLHLTAEFLLRKTPKLNRSSLPLKIDILPNTFIINTSEIVCSFADFTCPDDCAEGDKCSVTGEERMPMYAFLGGMEFTGFNILVLRSRQIAPGIGGYAFGDLTSLQHQLKPGNNLVITACRCHAFISALNLHESS